LDDDRSAGRASDENCSSDGQPRFRRATEDIGERFKSPLRHEPVACSSTTVASVWSHSSSSGTVHRRSPGSCSRRPRTVPDPGERWSALLEGVVRPAKFMDSAGLRCPSRSDGQMVGCSLSMTGLSMRGLGILGGGWAAGSGGPFPGSCRLRLVTHASRAVTQDRLGCWPWLAWRMCGSARRISS